MAYTENLATDLAGKKFESALVENAGVNEFVAFAGANRRTLNGEVIADARVQVGFEEGFGLSFGAQNDSEAANDTETTSFMSLFKRALGHLTGLRSGIGATADAEATPGGEGSLSGKLRNIAINVYQIFESFGSAVDVAASSASDVTMMARLRQLSGLIESRLPTSLGRKAAAATLAVSLSDEDLAKLEAVRAVLAPASIGGYDTAVAIPATAGGALIQAATASRKRLIIKNSEDGVSAIIWLGFDATLTAGKSGKNIGPLYPGESVTLDYTGAVYGITSSGTAYAAPAEMS